MKLAILPYEYDGEKVKNVLCMAKTEDISRFNVKQVLSDPEVDRHNSFKTESGKIQYLIGRYATKLVYPQNIPKNQNLRAIGIKNGIFEQPILNDLEFDVSTVAWHLKETLSKAIRTGLKIPLELLKIEDLIKKAEDMIICKFANFSQYGVIVRIEEKHVISLGYPQQLTTGEF